MTMTSPAAPVEPRRRTARTAPLHYAKRAARWATATSARPTARLRILPEFLIVGAQRSGTTSLHRYLVQHPAVAPAAFDLKGVHYFDTHFTKGWSWYRGHFPTVLQARYVARRVGTPLVTGEGSPYYMFHPLAPERIAAALPQAKLIVLLRDPVKRAYSHYQHMLFEGLERLPSFEEAIEREPQRLAGEVEKIVADPGYVSFHHQHHSYLARGRYAEQVERLYSLFPEHQILLMETSRLTADPAAGLQRVLDFLGLPPFTPEVFKSHNAGRYPAMDPATRRRLVDDFAPHNQRLYDFLDVDFHWGE